MDSHKEINDLILLANNSKDSRDVVKDIELRVRNISFPEDSYQIKTNKHTLDRWPNQTWYQCLMGEIFFPDDLRHNKEVPITLYETPKNRIMLAIACSYQNPLALYHLEQCCSIFYCKNSKIARIAKDLAYRLRYKYKPLLKLGFESGNSYIKVISSWYLSLPGSKDLVETGIESGEYRLLTFFF